MRRERPPRSSASYLMSRFGPECLWRQSRGRRRPRTRPAQQLPRPLPQPRSAAESSDGGMNEPPEPSDPEACARYLRELGTTHGGALPIAEAALALASFDRPRVDFGRYRDHLQLLTRDVGRHPGAAGDLAARARALNEIILLKYGYSRDELSYDDLPHPHPMTGSDRPHGP